MRNISQRINSDSNKKSHIAIGRKYVEVAHHI